MVRPPDPLAAAVAAAAALSVVAVPGGGWLMAGRRATTGDVEAAVARWLDDAKGRAGLEPVGERYVADVVTTLRRVGSEAVIRLDDETRVPLCALPEDSGGFRRRRDTGVRP